ncbi:MAG: hypothetical protein ACPG1A_14240 [Halioglobus sp.]
MTPTILDILEANPHLCMDDPSDRMLLAVELRKGLSDALWNFNGTIGDDGYGGATVIEEFEEANTKAEQRR